MPEKSAVLMEHAEQNFAVLDGVLEMMVAGHKLPEYYALRETMLQADSELMIISKFPRGVAKKTRQLWARGEARNLVRVLAWLKRQFMRTPITVKPGHEKLQLLKFRLNALAQAGGLQSPVPSLTGLRSPVPSLTGSRSPMPDVSPTSPFQRTTSHTSSSGDSDYWKRLEYPSSDSGDSSCEEFTDDEKMESAVLKDQMSTMMKDQGPKPAHALPPATLPPPAAPLCVIGDTTEEEENDQMRAMVRAKLPKKKKKKKKKQSGPKPKKQKKNDVLKPKPESKKQKKKLEEGPKPKKAVLKKPAAAAAPLRRPAAAAAPLQKKPCMQRPAAAAPLGSAGEASNDVAALLAFRLVKLSEDDMDMLKEFDYAERAENYAKMQTKNLHTSLVRDPWIGYLRYKTKLFTCRSVDHGQILKDDRSLVQLTAGATQGVPLKLAMKPLLQLAYCGFCKEDLEVIKKSEQFRLLFLNAGCLA